MRNIIVDKERLATLPPDIRKFTKLQTLILHRTIEAPIGRFGFRRDVRVMVARGNLLGYDGYCITTVIDWKSIVTDRA